jgi:hypothetical protein
VARPPRRRTTDPRAGGPLPILLLLVVALTVSALAVALPGALSAASLRSGASPAAHGDSVVPRVVAEPRPAVSTFSVVFNESGLPNGTNWSVTFNGSRTSTNASTITLLEPNGTYGYELGAVEGYSADPASGTLNVTGSSANISVRFTAEAPSKNPLILTEVGLPSGTAWSVTVNNTTERRSSTGS